MTAASQSRIPNRIALSAADEAVAAGADRVSGIRTALERAVSDGVELGRVGVWLARPPGPSLSRGLDELGYGAIWLGGSPGGDLADVEQILAATRRLVVATGIVNIWKDEPASIAAAYHRLVGTYPGRFLLGVGAGHPEATSQYQQPYQALVRYLDGLDAGGVPQQHRVLAALGPKVLRLAAERTAGAHPYLVPPEHTRQARNLIGAGAILAPEQHVVLDPDVARGRETARRALRRYLTLTNYTGNWRRLGFTDHDIDTASDRLIDGLVAVGDAEAIAGRVTQHLQAGADHVCVQLITSDESTALDSFAALASPLLT